jgi:hypothetical protein
MSMKNALDLFFDPNNGDQDAFAKTLGWEDAAQMIYYEDMAAQEEQKLHELDKVDPREVYEDTDWSGVY